MGGQFWNRTFDDELRKVDITEIRQLINGEVELMDGDYIREGGWLDH